VRVRRSQRRSWEVTGAPERTYVIADSGRLRGMTSAAPGRMQMSRLCRVLPSGVLRRPGIVRGRIYGRGMVFWQLTFDANDPALLARFWAQALGYQPAPPADPETTWHQHYRARLGEEAAFDDRLFDPAGLRPPIWFQEVPEAKAGKNRLHLDLYPTGRDNALPLKRRIEIVEAKVAELAGLGASTERRTRHDDPDDPVYYVVMRDPEGNEFCVS